MKNELEYHKRKSNTWRRDQIFISNEIISKILILMCKHNFIITKNVWRNTILKFCNG